MRLILSILFLNLSLCSFSQNFAVFINEINYTANNPTERGLELAGEAGSSLEGWSLVYYAVDGTIDYAEYMSGILPNQQGGYGVGWYEIDQYSNGGGVALVNSSGGVVQYLSYGTATYLQATEGPAVGLVAEHIGVQLSPSESLQLTGTGLTYLDFVWGLPGDSNLGNVNTNQVFGLLFRSDEDSENNPLTLETMNFTAFPNPTIDQLQITFPEISAESAIMEIFSIDGKLMNQQKIESGTTQITADFSNYQSGQYLIVLKEGKQHQSKMIIKS